MAFSFRKPLNFQSASAPAAALLVAVALLMLPLLSVLVSWLQFDALASSVWQQMLQTVLPDYALTTFILCTSVAVGVALVGMEHTFDYGLCPFQLRSTTRRWCKRPLSKNW